MTPATWAVHLADASKRLAQAGVVGGAGDARRILAHALGIDPARLTMHLGDDVTPDDLRHFNDLIARRMTHQPVSQIIGKREFWGRMFRVTPDVLDPRPETETIISQCLNVESSSILDLGTGSGCILVTLLAEWPKATGTGADISPDALKVAMLNARELGVNDRARFVCSDWFSQIDGQFNLIVSNPPYITAEEMKSLAPDVLNHEPHLALSPGGDGLDPYRILAKQSGAYLTSGGRILVEFGWRQADAVQKIFADQGWENIDCHQDLSGHTRCLCATRPNGHETSKTN